MEYADDIALLAHTHRNMQQKIDALNTEAHKVGLKINIAKTKTLRLNAGNIRPLVINNTNIEDVTTFNYLGSTLTTSGGAEEDINNRIKLARMAFAKLWAIWRSPQITKGTKTRIYEACVKSILLYGSETWLLKNSSTNRLQVFENKCLRTIQNIRWPRRISNEELLRISGQETILCQIKRRKWRWIGHTLRKEPENIARQALDWNPQGKRSVGRPRITWRRSVAKEIENSGRTWAEVKQLAHNRVRYRSFVEALCSPRG